MVFGELGVDELLGSRVSGRRGRRVDIWESELVELFETWQIKTVDTYRVANREYR